MLAHSLIERYLIDGNAPSVVSAALNEASVGQLRKQKPWLESVIQYLRDESKINDKYIPWVIAHLEADYLEAFADLKKQGKNATLPSFFTRLEFKTHIYLYADIVDRFEKAYQSKKLDAAIKAGLIKNPKIKDITFWVGQVKTSFQSGDAIEVLDNLLQRVKNLQSRKEMKAKDSDLIYKDNRFTVYRPKTHEASCILGAGTKWCISGKNSPYYDDYTAQGKAFAFIMDVGGDDNYYKIAVVVDLHCIDNKWEFFDAADRGVTELMVSEALSSANWSKIKSKIASYMKKQEPEIVRGDYEYWAGDHVEYAQHSGDTYAKADSNVRSYWLDPYRFEYVPKELLRASSDLFDVVVDAVKSLYSMAYGVIISPPRTLHNDPEPMVQVEGTYGVIKTDWAEVLAKFFPIGPKPPNPIKSAGKQQWLPGMAKKVADDYVSVVSAWENSKKPRAEFKDKVIVPLQRMSGGQWEEEVYALELVVTRQV